MEHSKEWHRDNISRLESKKKDLKDIVGTLLSFYLILISAGFAFLIYYTGKNDSPRIILYSIIILLISAIALIFVLNFIVLRSIYNKYISNNYNFILKE